MTEYINLSHNTIDKFDTLINNFNKLTINTDPKQIIIDMFMQNIKGKKVLIDKTHCGSEGHWLETQMGITHNSKNLPDIYGYEMKKSSKKITIGDFSASEYLFSINKPIIDKINKWNPSVSITRIEFIRYFGSIKHKKNRYSWSGSCIPKYGSWNSFGQILRFNDENDLCIYYSFDRDKRKEKKSYPKFIQGEIIIAIWYRNKLESHINNKYNNNGFFICKKNK